MLRRILIVLGALVVLAVAFVAGGLFLAGRAIRALDPELPSLDAILAYDPAADLPVRISWLNTASQKMPRSAVLDSGQDPTPDAPYTMGHVAVRARVVGRAHLPDRRGHGRRGRDRLRRAARDALRRGPDPCRSARWRRSSGSRSGASRASRSRTSTPTTPPASPLCVACTTQPIRLIQNRLQVEESNYTTRPGLAQLADATCLEPEIVDGGPLFRVQGFPGLVVLRRGGSHARLAGLRRARARQRRRAHVRADR